MSSKNRSISRSQQRTEFQSGFDGKKLIFNIDVKENNVSQTDVGIEVNRAHLLKRSESILWFENSSQEDGATVVESLPFDYLSSWKMGNILPEKLNILKADLITGDYSIDDAFNIGTNSKNMSFDNKTIQTRSFSANAPSKLTQLLMSGPQDRSSAEGALFINPYGGSVYLGDQWNNDATNKCYEIRLSALHIEFAGGYLDFISNVGDTNISSVENVKISGQNVAITSTSSFTINNKTVATITRGAGNPTLISNPANDNDIFINTLTKDIWYFDHSGTEWINTADYGTYGI